MRLPASHPDLQSVKSIETPALNVMQQHRGCVGESASRSAALCESHLHELMARGAPSYCYDGPRVCAGAPLCAVALPPLLLSRSPPGPTLCLNAPARFVLATVVRRRLRLLSFWGLPPPPLLLLFPSSLSSAWSDSEEWSWGACNLHFSRVQAATRASTVSASRGCVAPWPRALCPAKQHQH